MPTKKQMADRKAKSICVCCGSRPSLDFSVCSICRENQRIYHWNLQLKVFAFLGNKCVVCGESEPMFLEVDHINNDGHKHRKALGGSRRVQHWILANLDMAHKVVQLLCANCHRAKRRNKGKLWHRISKE